MIPSPPRRTIVPLLAVCLASLVGCATSTQSKFYTLTPMKAADAPASGVPIEEGSILAVGPVRLPDYLDRPQIMTRTEGNEVGMRETERWAGSLEGDVARVLIENLSVLLDEKSVAVVQWTTAMQSMAPFRNRLGVDVLRFEGSVGGEVVLKARYSLFGPDGRKVVSAGESIVREPVGGTDYGALTAAMSRALAAFSREVAAVIPAR